MAIASPSADGCSRGAGQSDEDRLETCIDLIYEAGSGPGAWKPALASIATLFHAEAALVIDREFPRAPPRFMIDHGVDPTVWADYAAHYWRHDLWAIAGERLGWTSGRVVDARSLIPEQVVATSPWYNEFLAKYDFGPSLMAQLSNHLESAAAITCLRRWQGEQFESREHKLMRALAPHVRRALRLHKRLLDAQDRASNLAAALDGLIDGIIIVDRDLRIQFMNIAAENRLVAHDGLATIDGRLVAIEPTATRELSRSIEQTLMPLVGLARSQPVLLPRREKGRPLAAEPARLPEAVAIRLNKPAPLVAVIIVDPNLRSRANETMLQQLYSLTRAEAYLASQVAQGKRLTEIAGELEVTHETARSRLKSIFAKTETHSQAELAKLILSGAAGAIRGVAKDGDPSR